MYRKNECLKDQFDPLPFNFRFIFPPRGWSLVEPTTKAGIIENYARDLTKEFLTAIEDENFRRRILEELMWSRIQTALESGTLPFLDLLEIVYLEIILTILESKTDEFSKLDSPNQDLSLFVYKLLNETLFNEKNRF